MVNFVYQNHVFKQSYRRVWMWNLIFSYDIVVFMQALFTVCCNIGRGHILVEGKTKTTKEHQRFNDGNYFFCTSYNINGVINHWYSRGTISWCDQSLKWNSLDGELHCGLCAIKFEIDSSSKGQCSVYNLLFYAFLQALSRCMF